MSHRRPGRLPVSLPRHLRTLRHASMVRELSIRFLQRRWKVYDKGRIAAARGNRREALMYFREAVTLDPEFAAAYNDLGAVYLAQGELSHAAEQFPAGPRCRAHPPAGIGESGRHTDSYEPVS